MTKVREAAMRLLFRREHSAYELAEKLSQRGFEADDIAEEIAHCQQHNLQSDSRFAESMLRVRVQQGYGPLKIVQELKAKQVSSEIIEQVLSQEDANWPTHASAVWIKKYKDSLASNFEELQKRQRFLLYRGFSAEMIAKVVKNMQQNKN